MILRPVAALAARESEHAKRHDTASSRGLLNSNLHRRENLKSHHRFSQNFVHRDVTPHVSCYVISWQTMEITFVNTDAIFGCLATRQRLR
jgi:hypothetical protein